MVLNSESITPLFKPGVFLLDLDLPSEGFRPELVFDDILFLKRQEFHLSLITAAEGFLEKVGEAKAYWALKVASLGIYWQVRVLQEAYRVTRSCNRQNPYRRDTIILMCEVTGANVFYKKLQELSGFVGDKNKPPAEPRKQYITLYCAGNYNGIDLVSHRDFETFSKQIPFDSLRS